MYLFKHAGAVKIFKQQSMIILCVTTMSLDKPKVGSCTYEFKVNRKTEYNVSQNKLLSSKGNLPNVGVGLLKNRRKTLNGFLFKPFNFLFKNPRLRTVSIDFNQNARFTYIKKGLEKLLFNNKDSAQKHTLLDVGAGLGTLTDYISKEFNFSALNVEVTNAKKLEGLVVASGLSLPFKNDAFDFAVSCDVLEHIGQTDRADFITELLRCSKKGVVLTYCKIHTRNPLASGIKIFEKVHRGFPKWYVEHNSNGLVDDLAFVDALKGCRVKVERKSLTGVFSLFFLGVQSRLPAFVGVTFFANSCFYLVTRFLDPPPYYSFGVTITKIPVKLDRSVCM
jgi:SAM-dependent methyltransferase